MSSWLSSHNIKRRPINIVINNKKNISYSDSDIIPSCERLQISTLNYNFSNIYSPFLINKQDNKIISKIKDNYNKYIPNVKKIVNVYQLVYKNNILASGIGDFIRGTICLYQLCKVCNIEFDININNHEISQFIQVKNKEILHKNILDNIIFNRDCDNMSHDNINNLYSYNYKSLDKLFITFKQSIIVNDILYVFCNSYPYFTIDDEEYLYIKNNLLCFNDDIIRESNIILQRVNFNINNYNILHIRSGDKYINSNININRNIIENIHTIIKNELLIHDDTIILSDSNNISDIISSQYNTIKNTRLEITHTGEEVIKDINKIKNTIIELYLMCNSKKIILLTTNRHGSGFSLWPALCYNIEYKCGYHNN